MAQQEFIPYEQALELRQLGFDNLPLYYYNSDGHLTPFINFVNNVKPNNQSLIDGVCYAPLYQQAFRWFREKYNLYSYMEPMANKFIYQIKPHILNHYKEDETYVFNTYEQTELSCLIKLIEIVKNK